MLNKIELSEINFQVYPEEKIMMVGGVKADGETFHIATVPLPDWAKTYDECDDGPEARKIAIETANCLGYYVPGAIEAIKLPYWAAHIAWDMFRTAHPNFLSRDLQIANAVFFRLYDIDWDSDPEGFQKVCEVVSGLVDATYESVDHIVEVMSDLLAEGAITIEGLKRDYYCFRTPVANKLKGIRKNG